MKENIHSVFDEVLHSVGNDGRFQKRFNMIFNFGVSVTGTMVYVNLILALAIPEHWCNVPGREISNKTLEDWKTITLPREKDSSGFYTTSSCRMYNTTFDDLTNENLNDSTIVDCKYNFEYDKKWYSSTIPSSQHWVCAKELYVSNLLAVIKIGEVFGCFVISHLGDIIGRRPICIIGVFFSAFGRLTSVFVVDNYVLFLICSIIASLPSTTGSQACQVILTEISPVEKRALIAEIACVGWSIASSILPLVYWVCRDWEYFIIITTIPLALYIPLTFFMIESPRWLLSRGRMDNCVKELKNISKTNGTTFSPDMSNKLNNFVIQPEKVYGIYSLFSSFRLTKNTLLLVVCWISNLLVYNIILLGVANISGNPFINFFLQSIAEIPSLTAGKILCSRLGRRLAGGIGFVIVIGCTSAFMIIMSNSNLNWLQIIFISLVKFSITMTNYVTVLQSIEIYPTCIRQTGFTLGLITGNALSATFPYIVYLGSNYNVYIPYMIILLLGVLSLVSQIFLPETLNEMLPETLNEASLFGVEQSLLTLPRARKPDYKLTDQKNENDQSDAE